MTAGRKRKQEIRERMRETGESYMQASLVIGRAKQEKETGSEHTGS